MAIGYDATSTFNFKTPGSGPLTYSHTVGSGSNRLILIFVTITADVITSVTYNGVSATLLKKSSAQFNEFASVYGLLAPATGTNTVSISYTGSQYIRSGSISYDGVSQSDLPDATGETSAGSGTSLSTTITTVADNCWVSGIVFANNNDTLSAGSGFTGRLIANGFILEDTNGPKTPAGSVTFAASWTTSTYYFGAAVSFAPANEAIDTSNFFNLF